MAATCLKAGHQGGAADAFALAIQNVRAPGVLYDENGQLCSGPFDLRLVVRARTEAGDEKGALEWLADQTSPFVKAVALAGVAEGMIAIELLGPDWDAGIILEQEYYRKEHRYCQTEEGIEKARQEYFAHGENVLRASITPVGPWCVYWWERFASGFMMEAEIGEPQS